MELTQLRAFITVADESNLTRAAALLFLTPPSVSTRIRSLEDELGVQLFVRSARGMQLSQEGRLLEPRARQLLRDAEGFVDDARKLQQQAEGNMRLGLNTSPSLLRVSALVARMQQDYPRLDISLLPSVSVDISRQVAAGSMDAGFVYGEVSQPSLAAMQLQRTRVAVIAPRGWQERLSGISRAELGQQPWIWVSSYCPYYHLLEQLFDNDQPPANIVASADDEQTTLDLVRAGVGIAIVEEGLAAADLEQGSVVRLDIQPVSIPLSLIWLNSRRQDPQIAALQQTLREIWPQSR